MSPRNRHLRLRVGAVVLPLALGWVTGAHASGLEEARTEVTNVDREIGSVQSAVERAKTQRLSPEQRLANGELLFRGKDYARATVVFGELIEEFPDTPSFTDARWHRGETFNAARAYLSARRD